MSRKLANSQKSNFLTYEKYKRELLTLAENVFEFKNLPTIIDTAFLNKTLLRKGAIAFFYDEELESVIALPFTNAGALDIYGRPINIEVYASNGYTKMLKKGEYIIMYDNNGRYPLYIDILQHAERIADAKRVIDINIAQQKTPRIWKTTTEKERSVKDLLNQYDGNVETVLTYDGLSLNDVETVSSPAPYVTDKICDYIDREYAEFFQLIGVANNRIEKKERLITDEMEASLGGTIASRYSRFEPRKKAIDEINAMFNLNMEVSYYDGIPTSKEEIENNRLEEVENDNK